MLLRKYDKWRRISQKARREVARLQKELEKEKEKEIKKDMDTDDGANVVMNQNDDDE